VFRQWENGERLLTVVFQQWENVKNCGTVVFRQWENGESGVCNGENGERLLNSGVSAMGKMAKGCWTVVFQQWGKCENC
jgi:hypothetical protein